MDINDYVIIFMSIHIVRGGRRSRVTVHFFNVVFGALRFGGVSKSIFSKYSFDGEGGGHKKSTLCTFLIMLPTLDDSPRTHDHRVHGEHDREPLFAIAKRGKTWFGHLTLHDSLYKASSMDFVGEGGHIRAGPT